MMKGWVSAVVLSTGCSTLQVQGTIDGQEVPLEVSMFREVPNAYGDDSQVQITLSSVPNACRVYAYLEDELEENGGGWRNRTIAYQRSLPTDYWEMVLTLRVASIDELSMLGTVFNGVDYKKLTVGSVGQVRSDLRHYVRHPDPGDEENSSDWYVSYAGDGGAADLEAYELGPENQGQWLSGAFASSFVDKDDGTPRGELGVRFDSLGCDVLPVSAHF